MPLKPTMIGEDAPERRWRPELGSPVARGNEPQSLLDRPEVRNPGNSIEVVFNPPPLSSYTGDGQTLLNLESDDETARIVEVFLTAELSTIGARDAVAILEWGSGGHRAPRTELDFLNGTAFSLACSSLRIFVRQDAPKISVPPTIRLGAFVGYGTRPGGLQLRGPQRTLKIPIIAPGGVADFPIPFFSTSVTAIRSPAASPYTIRMLNGTGGTLGDTPVGAGADLFGLPLAIPNDAVFVRIIDGGAGLAVGRLIFGLTF